ncbi:MAG: PAS domain S-box protein [Cytophagales bacterium]|nr:PAS domain S-box protein [Cytophagales bacterium]
MPGSPEQWLGQYRFILDQTPAMLWTATPAGQVDYVNEWMVRFTGREAGQLLGEAWLDVIHPGDRERVVREWQRALREQTPSRAEVRFRRADGAYLWHQRTVIPYRDGQKDLVRWVGINTDIEEQKAREAAQRENEVLRQTQLRLEAEKEFSGRLLENSTDGLLALDAEGNVTAWNKTLEILSGKPRRQVLGRPAGEVLFPAVAAADNGAAASPEATPPDPQSSYALARAVGKALAGNPVTLFGLGVPFAPAGRLYEIILQPFPREGDRATGLLGIVRDVTEGVQREEDRLRRELLGQREVLQAVLHAQEEERERIVESLHNGLGQILFAVRLNLQNYLARIAEDDPGAGPLRKANDLLKEAIVQSRIISADLVPSILRDHGLPAALGDWIDKLSTPALHIHLRVVGLEARLAPALELNVFRIVQALLGNVLLRSEATQVDVLLIRSGSGLSLLVEDNGKDLTDDERAALNGNTGMRSVHSRAALLGGRVSLDATPGAGTAVRVFLPLPGPGH